MRLELFRSVESTIRAVGVDDGSFRTREDRQNQTTVLVAVMTRGRTLLATRVENVTVDGSDSTRAVLRLVRNWGFDCLILSGITFAGFNIVDVVQIYQKTGKPVLVVSESKPRQRLVRAALQRHFSDWRDRWALVKQAGRIRSAVTYSTKRPIYFEVIGVPATTARKVLRGLCLSARIPEPVRLAGLLAKGLTSD